MGCGTKQYSRTLEKSEFDCPRCEKSGKGARQRYRLENFRKWVTLIWIPIIPMGGGFDQVTCYGCRGQYPPNLVDPV